MTGEHLLSTKHPETPLVCTLSAKELGSRSISKRKSTHRIFSGAPLAPMTYFVRAVLISRYLKRRFLLIVYAEKRRKASLRKVVAHTVGTSLGFDIERGCRSTVRHVHIGLPPGVPFAADCPLDLRRQLQQQPVIGLLGDSLDAERKGVLVGCERQ